MPFMEFRGIYVESAAGLWTTGEMGVPTSKTEKMALLMHVVWLLVNAPDPVDAKIRETDVQLLKEDSNAAVDIQEWNYLAGQNRAWDAGRAEGTLSEYSRSQDQQMVIQYFSPPVLIARDSLWVGTRGKENGVEANYAAVVTSAVRIGYTLEKVPTAEFIAALVE